MVWRWLWFLVVRPLREFGQRGGPRLVRPNGTHRQLLAAGALVVMLMAVMNDAVAADNGGIYGVGIAAGAVCPRDHQPARSQRCASIAKAVAVAARGRSDDREWCLSYFRSWWRSGQHRRDRNQVSAPSPFLSLRRHVCHRSVLSLCLGQLWSGRCLSYWPSNAHSISVSSVVVAAAVLVMHTA